MKAGTAAAGAGRHLGPQAKTAPREAHLEEGLAPRGPWQTLDLEPCVSLRTEEVQE